MKPLVMSSQSWLEPQGARKLLALNKRTKIRWSQSSLKYTRLYKICLILLLISKSDPFSCLLLSGNNLGREPSHSLTKRLTRLERCRYGINLEIIFLLSIRIIKNPAQPATRLRPSINSRQPVRTMPAMVTVSELKSTRRRFSPYPSQLGVLWPLFL